MSVELLESRIAPTVFTVTNLGDYKTGQPVILGSLRAAMQAAGTSSDTTNTIDFAANLHGKILLQSALPLIAKSLTIEDAKAGRVTIDGHNEFQIFQFISGGSSGITSRLQGLTLTHGRGESGGAIEMSDSNLTLNLASCSVTGNKAIGAPAGSGESYGHTGTGGGIDVNEGSLVVTLSRISGNVAMGGPGGLAAGGEARGGGLYIASGATVSLDTSTVSGNIAIGSVSHIGSNGVQGSNGGDGGNGQRGGDGGSGRGGGIFNNGALTITNSTISGNQAVGAKGLRAGNGGPGSVDGMNGGMGGSGGNGGNGLGGGIASYLGSTNTIRNSTLSGNSAIRGLPGPGGLGGARGAGGTAGARGSPGLAGGSGGGGFFLNDGALTFSQVTLAKNTAIDGGGAYLVEPSSASIHNCTIAFNHSTRGASGLDVDGATNVEIISTIIAQNSRSSTCFDLNGPQNVSFSLIQSFNTATPPTGFENVLNQSAKLSALGHHGGLTQTCLPLRHGSPAIGNGSNPDNLDEDQRGDPRTDTGFIDIGSVQVS